MKKFIYLDHNSTAPMLPEVANKMTECFAAGFVNPASQHRPGQLARKHLEDARRKIANYLGAKTSGMDTDQLIFTSGGTESNNLAILGLVNTPDSDPGNKPSLFTPQHILISSIEHPSVIGAAEQLVRLGHSVDKIPVDSNGVCRVDRLDSMINDNTKLISLMLANNETGVVQPVNEVAQLCRDRDILFHTDAVQAVGKVPVHFQELSVDALSFTGHKFGGPRGIGGLILRHGLTPAPLQFGGFQQMALRPGTEDVALVAGMETALEIFHKNETDYYSDVLVLRNHLEKTLLSRFPDLVINGVNATRLPHVSNLSLPEVDRQSFLMAADMKGLAISTGSACASGSSELSPVLLAMGLEKSIIENSVRISLGVSNTRDEIENTIEIISQILS
ncbi:MAG: cysteine desulfurase family protein [Mariniblastus sp.]|nr:cysteine desulfurase family protein [Mariniblastus sp.]MDG2181583.1 cysteine desulfurase family protein [Mariniblastus sp.]